MFRIGQAVASLSRPAQLASLGIVLTVLVLGGWAVSLRAADVSHTVPAGPDGSLDPGPGADPGGAADDAGDDRDEQGDAGGGSGGPGPDGEPKGQKTNGDDATEDPDPDPPRQPEGSPA